MANRLTGITIDCADPARLASFWSALLDRAVTGEHGEDAGWATVGSRLDDRPRLTFQRVSEPRTTKVRIHLDVQVNDIGAARRHVEQVPVAAGPASGTTTTRGSSWSCTIRRDMSSAWSSTTAKGRKPTARRRRPATCGAARGHPHPAPGSPIQDERMTVRGLSTRKTRNVTGPSLHAPDRRLCALGLMAHPRNWLAHNRQFRTRPRPSRTR